MTKDESLAHFSLSPKDIEPPPTTMLGIVRRLGPGLIIAASIVGSGELIATTKTGAEAGFWLLWLILIGCLIKVFVQVELGRHTVATGRAAMDAMNDVPGPRVRGHGNWMVWYFVVMFVASIAQLGGIVGGVGQALQIAAPLTENGRRYNEIVDARMTLRVKQAELISVREGNEGTATDQSAITQLETEVAVLQQQVDELGDPPQAHDTLIWAAILTVITAAMLLVGRYGLIQAVSAALVAAFTFVTIVNVVLLQSNPVWAVTPGEIMQGLSFRLPPQVAGSNLDPLITALAAFGIIGVGATELIQYPYWCLEKGYARFTGAISDSAEWGERARGWMRVMRWDAWASMVVYTFATIAFFLLGAAILGRVGLNPSGDEMVRTLAVMYEPVFGEFAQMLFLFGAFAVLYSTFFVATAGHTRVFPDTLRVLGLIGKSDRIYRRWTAILCVLFPAVALGFYVVIGQPVLLVLISGAFQAVMLPMLALAAIFFRYRRCDRRITPGRLWDLLLWLSALGMLIAGGWLAWDKITQFAQTILSFFGGTT
jgi:Mn2+/Fe2+ NRAMP family transporter